MGKILSILIIALFALSSCSKKPDVKPIDHCAIENNSLAIIKVDNVVYSKVADMYATGAEKRNDNKILHSSSFNIIANREQSMVSVSLISNSKNIGSGIYSLEAEKENSTVTFADAQGVKWSSKNGHQKGSAFEVINVETLNDGNYYQKATVKISCFVYNQTGAVKGITLYTDIKY